MGPTTKAITVTGGVTFDGLLDSLRAGEGIGGGPVGLLLVEGWQDTRNIKAAILAIQKFQRNWDGGAVHRFGDD